MNLPDLQNLGLTAKESNLYRAALSLGTAPIAQLARRAGLKRPTTYLVIDSLLEKNLLVAVPRGKTVSYKAQNPRKLLEKLEEQKVVLQSALPDLIKVYRQHAKQPKVRFYEGKERLRELYEEIWRSKEIWGMVSPEKFLLVFSHEDNRHFFRILGRQNGVIYDMLENTKVAREFAQQKYRTALSEVRFLKRGLHVPTDILVSGNKTALVSLTNVVGVLIDDRDIATSLKTMLQVMWTGAKVPS